MARVALDSENKRVYADRVKPGGEYFCPICHDKMYLRRGAYTVSHFAHYPNRACTDSFRYEEMSEWHVEWQCRFPLECQEVVIEKDGVFHRADVLLEKSKVVIEFQHSPLSSSEFDKRNRFYVSCGYKVVWVFDMLEEYATGRIKPSERNKSVSEYPTSRDTFNNFNAKSKNVSLFFHRRNEEKKEKNVLEHVIWISPAGISRFVSETFELNSFIAFCNGEKRDFTIRTKSIPYFWKEYNCVSMIVLNKNTGHRILVTQDPLASLEKYHVVYGRKENSFGEFSKKSVAIPEAKDGIFELVWKVSKGDPGTKV